MKKLLIILFLLPIASYGQELYVSPTSVALWGSSPAVSSASFEYGDFEAVYLFAAKTMHDYQGGIMKGGYFGVFWKPVELNVSRFEAKGGMGYLFRKFPTINGTNINFTAQLTFKLNDCIGIRYSHMSNGFGLVNDINPGVDSIGIEVSL